MGIIKPEDEVLEVSTGLCPIGVKDGKVYAHEWDFDYRMCLDSVFNILLSAVYIDVQGHKRFRPKP